MNLLIFLPLLASFFIVMAFMPLWIKKARTRKFLWNDMNKFGSPKNVAASGGIVVVLAFVLGALTYVGFRTFIAKAYDGESIGIFAAVITILILGLVGIIDDLWGWKSKGMAKKWKLLLAFFASIPLIVINAGVSTMNVPFLGSVNFGLLYPLLLVPLGIVGAANAFNFLAGMNSLEATQGIIILSFLSFVAYLTGSAWLAVVGMTMVFSLLGFYIFNRFPARVFPGDSMTLSVGALAAIMSILGNFEKIAVFVFIPYIIETVLKARGKLEKQSFGKPNRDGSLELPEGKVYGLTHFAIYILKKIKPNHKAYEKEAVYLINAFQVLIVVVAFLLFF